MTDTYFNRTVEGTLEQMRAAPEGLSAEAAAQRLAKYGPNRLQEGETEKRRTGLFGTMQGSAGPHLDGGGADGSDPAEQDGPGEKKTPLVMG